MGSLNTCVECRKWETRAGMAGHVGEHLEQTDEVTREYIPALLPAVLVKKLAAPPSILGSGSDGNDIASLEVKLLLDRRRVIVQSFH